MSEASHHGETKAIRTVGDRLKTLAQKPGFEHLKTKLPQEVSEVTGDDVTATAEAIPFERPWSKSVLAQFMGLTVSGLDKAIKMGRAPPFFRAGRMQRWRPSVVKAWALEQERRAEEDAARARVS